MYIAQFPVVYWNTVYLHLQAIMKKYFSEALNKNMAVFKSEHGRVLGWTRPRLNINAALF